MPVITEATPIAFSGPIPEAVDVVVIGGGIVGVSAAWFLAEAGVKVLLCEKGRIAGEQSCRNWGWVRQQGRDWAELPIMMEANRIWRELPARTGERDLTFTPSGSVYLAETASQLAKYETWHDLAKQHQLDTRLLSAEEATALAPTMSGHWIGGMQTASDGRAEPLIAVPALARAAAKKGASILEDCAVRTVETRSGEVDAVVTEQGRVRTDTVLLAGGAWSTHFAGNLGLDLPQLMVRSTAGRTNAVPAAPGAPIPNVSIAGFAIRSRDDGGYTIATGDLAEHYVSRKSFKYFTKFLKLMKISAKDVRLRPWPPSGYPGAWTSRTAPTASSAGACAVARRRRYRRGLGGHDRCHAGCRTLSVRGSVTTGIVHRHRDERPRLRHRAGSGTSAGGFDSRECAGTRPIPISLRAIQRRQPDRSGAVLKIDPQAQPMAARRRARHPFGHTFSRS
jgi:glycine/D-amino acid oxidase-like deaminating enzyme